MLTSDIPDLEIHVPKVDGRDILAYRGDGLLGGGWSGGEVQGFDGREKGGLACVVEPEEED